LYAGNTAPHKLSMYLKEKGLNTRDLANIMGVKYNTARRWMCQVTVPPLVARHVIQFLTSSAMADTCHVGDWVCTRELIEIEQAKRAITTLRRQRKVEVRNARERVAGRL